MNSKRWFVAGLSLVVTLRGMGAQTSRHGAFAGVPADRTSPFDAWWRQFMERRIGHASAGYAWVVLRRDQVLSAGGSGAAISDSTGRVTARMLPSTRMQIASASKPITAMALLLAMHDRGISVDTPVVSLLGDSLGPFGDHVRGKLRCDSCSRTVQVSPSDTSTVLVSRIHAKFWRLPFRICRATAHDIPISIFRWQERRSKP